MTVALPSQRDSAGSGPKQRGAARSEAFRSRVRLAMAAIEADMNANGGVYPHNGGKVSAAELARRADCHETTFHSPAQEDFTRAEIRPWFSRLKEAKPTSRASVRRTYAERASDWKALYDGLSQSHRDTNLALQQAEHELEKAMALNATLAKENERLRSTADVLSNSKLSQHRGPRS